MIDSTVQHQIPIVTREEALTQGLAYYYTGKPCKHGHVAERITSSGKCKVCRRVSQKEEYERNKSRYKQTGAIYRNTNKEKVAATGKSYRIKNRDELSEKKKSYYRKNKEKHQIKSKAYYIKNKEKIQEYYKQWSEENKEHLQRYSKEYREKNSGKLKDVKRAYHEKNKERIVQKANKWRKENPERRKEIANRWVKNNPEQGRKAANIRRARKHATGGSYTHADIECIRKAQKNKCAVCRKKLSKRFHIDHIKPLSKGGDNSRRNLQLTHPSCNQLKGAKDPLEFMQSRGFLL